jgi:hypothetical protein
VAGVVVIAAGRPLAVIGLTVTHGKIVEIDVIADPERVRRVGGAVLTEDQSPPGGGDRTPIGTTASTWTRSPGYGEED